MADIERKIRVVYEVKGQEKVASSLKEIRKDANELRKAFAEATDVTTMQQYGAELNNVKEKMNELTALGRNWSQGTTKSTSNVAHAMMNLNYVVRDSPYFFQNFALGVMAVGNNLNPLIDSMQRARAESKALNTTLGREMLTFLKGPGGIIFAMSLLVTAFQAVTFAMSKSKKGAEEFAGSLDLIKSAADKLITIKSPLDKLFFPVTPEQVPLLIRGIEEEIKVLDSLNTARQTDIGRRTGVGMQGLDARLFTSQLTKDEKDRQKSNDAIKKSLEEQLDSYKAMEIVFKKMKELGLEEESKEKGKKKKIADVDARGLTLLSSEEKLFKQRMQFIEDMKISIERSGGTWNEANREFVFYMSLQLKDKRDRTLPVGMQDVDEGFTKKMLKDAEQGTEDIKALYDDMWMSTTDVFVSNMIQGWEKIFGEANSMFEQLLLSWAAAFANAFLEKSATSLVSSLFDLFVPGLGTALGAMSGSPATQGGGNYYIVVDGDVIMPAVVRRLPQSIQRLQRLGKV